jgi:hypothetical protein
MRALLMMCLSAGVSLGIVSRRTTHSQRQKHLICPCRSGVEPSVLEIDRPRAKSVHLAPIFGRLAQR